MANLNILSLNCHGYNLRRVNNNSDVILLQETWLTDCTCSILDNLSNDFIVFHSSVMQDKISKNVIVGKPFGGTAVIVRKLLAGRCCRIATDNPRVTFVCMKSSGDVVFSSVYMSWNDRSIRHIG